jgi:hypothetical protein
MEGKFWAGARGMGATMVQEMRSGPRYAAIILPTSMCCVCANIGLNSLSLSCTRIGGVSCSHKKKKATLNNPLEKEMGEREVPFVIDENRPGASPAEGKCMP